MRERDAGLVLPMTLWIGVVLALIAGAALDLGRDDLAIARNLAERTRAELAAEGAVALAIHRLVATPHRGWPEGGSVRWRLEGAEARVAMVAESGLVDLNAAPRALLAALFVAAGLEAGLAERLAGTIEEARRNHAAAWAQTLVAPPAFAMVEDLGTLSGVSRAVSARLSPYLTVYTGLARPDPRLAPDTVRRALGLEPAETDATETAQRARIVRLHAEARTDAGAVAVRRAVVDLRLVDLGPRDGAAPWQLRLWTSGPRVLFPAPAPRSADGQ